MSMMQAQHNRRLSRSLNAHEFQHVRFMIEESAFLCNALAAGIVASTGTS